MTLYFLRHGHADHPSWSGPDASRPLTREGIETMRMEARTMTRLGILVGAVVSSPLVRARETAEIAARALRAGDSVIIDDRLAPGFGPADLPGIVASYGAKGALLLVGHEPDMSDTIGELIGGGRVVMKKGGLARIDRADHDGADWELVWLLAPRTLVS